MFAAPPAQSIFVAVKINTYYHVNSLVGNWTFLLEDCHSRISGMLRLVTLDIRVGDTSMPYS